MRTDHYNKQPETVGWETPQYLFDELDKEFNFIMDVCAHEYNHKYEHWFGEAIAGNTDGLAEQIKAGLS